MELLRPLKLEIHISSVFSPTSFAKSAIARVYRRGQRGHLRSYLSRAATRVRLLYQPRCKTVACTLKAASGRSLAAVSEDTRASLAMSSTQNVNFKT